MHDQDDLTPEEKRALGSLAEGGAPPAGLEDRTLAQLRQRGLIAGRRRRPLTWLLATAAACAIFVAGLSVGHQAAEGPAPASATSRFALFLYDAPDEKNLTEAQMGARVAEYRRWAGEVAREGAAIQGEKLEDESRLLGAAEPVAGGRLLGGYFVITAKDYDAALAVARTCPHLKHGGVIEVRAIAKT